MTTLTNVTFGVHPSVVAARENNCCVKENFSFPWKVVGYFQAVILTAMHDSGEVSDEEAFTEKSGGCWITFSGENFSGYCSYQMHYKAFEELFHTFNQIMTREFAHHIQGEAIKLGC